MMKYSQDLSVARKSSVHTAYLSHISTAYTYVHTVYLVHTYILYVYADVCVCDVKC